MQSRDHRHISFLLDRFTGKYRADRMRDSVMDMQQIELFRSCDRRHLRRECEIVRLMFEKRIRHHLDFVEMNSIVELGDTRRKHRRNEVHVMPALSKIASELRADNSAPAVCWINRDTDIHGY